MQERLPLEIHRLVDKTINQVEERHMNQQNPAKSSTDKMNDNGDIYCLDKANNEAKNEILKDLLWTLYSKMEAVLRGFRFTETCARRIKKVCCQYLTSNMLTDIVSTCAEAYSSTSIRWYSEDPRSY